MRSVRNSKSPALAPSARRADRVMPPGAALARGTRLGAYDISVVLNGSLSSADSSSPEFAKTLQSPKKTPGWTRHGVDVKFTRVHHRLEIDVRIADMNWMQVEEYLRARRPRRAAARQHGAAQSPAAHGRLHPPGARRRRRRRAARRSGVSGRAVRRHAVLPRVPRLDLAPRRDPPARRRATFSTAWRTAASAAS